MKNIYCSYYTNSDEITSYMVKRLSVEPKDVVLEPSAGEGIFIDKLLEQNIPMHIDALDINEQAIKILTTKYEGNSFVDVRKTDTLLDGKLDEYANNTQLWLKETDTILDEQLEFFGLTNGHYDKVIGNPPYGAWQDYDKRDILKKKYPGHYVKETYALFLLRCLSVLKIHGKLSFIIPDTYLFLNMHSRLRNILLTNSKIKEILIFPSKFFPGVSFGYSNLSIITLERASTSDSLNNTIRVIKGFSKPSELSLAFEENLSSQLTAYYLNQKQVLGNDDHRFILAKDELTEIINSNIPSLGEFADVVTGLYCGDNKRFIRVLNENIRGSKGYLSIGDARVAYSSDIHGIDSENEVYVPYIKSSSEKRYYRGESAWFVRWDKNAINYYNSNKKARFQNSQYYFKSGIAMPMVKANTVKATLMYGSVFDQSIVGIFPKDEVYLKYMLALMNSDIVNRIIHVINPTANNSANYIKKIPFVVPDKITLCKINSMIDTVIEETTRAEYKKADELHREIDSIITSLYLPQAAKVLA